MLALLVTTALAASPGGFRIGPGPGADMVGLRQVAVASGKTYTLQSVPRAHVSISDDWIVDLELPAVVTWGGGWSDAGLGQLRVGGWRAFTGGRGASFALGLELALPAAPPSARASAWGSLAREVLPGFELGLGFELTTDSPAPRTLRTFIGRRSGRLDDPNDPSFIFGDAHPALEVALAQVLPISGPFSAVLEGELVWDQVPVSLRALARIDHGPLSFDLGLQASPAPQPWAAAIGQLRWSLE